MKVFLLVLAFGVSANARIFNLKDQTFGTYIQVTGGPTLLGQSAFHRDDVTIENKSLYNAEGEFGLTFLASRTWIRLGVSVVRPQAVEGAQAKNDSDQSLYRVNSGVIAWGPTVNFEFPIGQYEKVRFFFTGGLGYMKVTVKNDYAFTDEGRTQYSLDNYTEEASNYAVMSQGGFGMETHLADYSTFILSAGYRNLVGSSLKHERAVPAMGGNISEGSVLNDSNGNERTLNLSGYWVGLGIRFYWNW